MMELINYLLFLIGVGYVLDVVGRVVVSQLDIEDEGVDSDE